MKGTIPDSGYMVAVLNKNGICFSRRETAKIVGGEERLRELVKSGHLCPTDTEGRLIETEVREQKNTLASTNRKNRKWNFRAGDVLRMARLKW